MGDFSYCVINLNIIQIGTRNKDVFITQYRHISVTNTLYGVKIIKLMGTTY